MSAARILGGALLAGAAHAPPPSPAVAVLPNGSAFTLEVAADEESRRVGYMFRESVGPAEGMLFVFAEDAIHPMWMKNCKVALDMLWLDASYRIVEVAADARPCPSEGDCPSIVPRSPSRFVLEVAAGTAARETLRVGDAIAVLHAPPGR